MIVRMTFIWRTNTMSSVKTGWIIGGTILVLLVSVSTVYTGRGTHPTNTTAQQPQR